MDRQEQRTVDEEFASQASNLDAGQDEPKDFGPGDFSSPVDAGDDWSDDESYLEDSTGRRMLYLIGGGILLLIVVAGLFFALSGGGQPSGDVSGVAQQVREMESRLSSLEATTNTWTMTLDRMAKNQQTIIDQNTRLASSLDAIKRDLDRKPAPRPVFSQPAAAPAAPAPAAPASTASSARKNHVVQKGDTLYSIHRKHNVSLDKLRSLNNLKEGQSIYSGQVLWLE